MSNALELFKLFQSGGYDEIDKMVKEQQEENLFLDFKRKGRPDHAGADRSDREIYGTALSGFSNASGGVIVWGVDSRKGPNKNDPDVAQQLEPIEYVKRYLTDLNSYLNQALIPANTGIQNILILEPDKNDTGFIVTYVPESDFAPHRALLGVDQYFTRAGDSFIKMEHHMLADMFGRRQKPKLEVSYYVELGGIFSDDHLVIATIGIKNVGRYVARFPAITIKSDKHQLVGRPVGGYSKKYWSVIQVKPIKYSPLNQSFIWSGGNDEVVHPYTSVEVVNFERLIKKTV
jgi:hypothetical protein